MCPVAGMSSLGVEGADKTLAGEDAEVDCKEREGEEVNAGAILEEEVAGGVDADSEGAAAEEGETNGTAGQKGEPTTEDEGEGAGGERLAPDATDA